MSISDFLSLVCCSTDSSKGSSESSGPQKAANGGNSGSKMCGPLTPDQALRLYRSQLSPMELSEIHSYPDVYFVGPNAKKRPAVAGGSNNCGYDDEQGGYIHVPHDHLAYRYEFLKVRRWSAAHLKAVSLVLIKIASDFNLCFAVFRLLVRAALARWLKCTTTSFSNTWR